MICQVLKNRFSPIFGFILLSFLITLPRLEAGLAFKQTIIEDTVSPVTKSYPFAFAFKNEGDSSVEISAIKTSCGCTTTKLEKMNYSPGEEGLIKGVFSIGNRQGKQEKKVRVITKNLAQPEIQLLLKIEIPPLVTVKPGLLVWRANSEPQVKALNIQPNLQLGAKILSVVCESDDFVIEPLFDESCEKFCEVVVAPLRTDKKRRGLIKIKVTVADAPPRTVYAHALVR